MRAPPRDCCRDQYRSDPHHDADDRRYREGVVICVQVLRADRVTLGSAEAWCTVGDCIAAQVVGEGARLHRVLHLGAHVIVGVAQPGEHQLVLELDRGGAGERLWLVGDGREAQTGGFSEGATTAAATALHLVAL